MQPRPYSPSGRTLWTLRQQGGNPQPSGFVVGTAPTLTASGNSTLAGSPFAPDQTDPTHPTFPPAAWGSQGSGQNGPGQPSPTSVDMPNSAIDLTDVTDLGLFVNVHGAPSGGTVTLQVQVDLLDDFGNIYANVLSLPAAMTATGSAVAFGGLHAPGGAGAPLTDEFLVLPRWAQVTWTLGSGSTWPGVDVSLYGR